MLTDQTRGPFTIKTEFTPATNLWENNAYWSWQLIGADGKCYEHGTGHGTKADAIAMAKAIRDNEMA